MTLKLKRTPGIYLVGFMGTGKTTVGRSVADELGWSFYDIDCEIEKREEKSIAEIFDTAGEPRFRELETMILARLVSQVQSGHPCVIATGGGAFVQPHNWDIVENNGVTVWLDCPIETIEQRLGPDDGTRPLARDRKNMRELFERRLPLYARADYRVNANCDDPSEVIQCILQLPIF